MSTYTLELKEQIVRKMMPAHKQSVAHLSRETGISGPTTLYAWKKPFQTRGFVVPAKPSIVDRTLRRLRGADTLVDQRKGLSLRPVPRALTVQEKDQILVVCNCPEHQSLPPGQSEYCPGATRAYQCG